MNLKWVAEEIAHYLFPNLCSFCKIKLLQKRWEYVSMPLQIAKNQQLG